jgi:hypothetical protein
MTMSDDPLAVVPGGGAPPTTTTRSKVDVSSCPVLRLLTTRPA